MPPKQNPMNAPQKLSKKQKKRLALLKVQQANAKPSNNPPVVVNNKQFQNQTPVFVNIRYPPPQYRAREVKDIVLTGPMQYKCLQPYNPQTIIVPPANVRPANPRPTNPRPTNPRLTNPGPNKVQPSKLQPSNRQPTQVVEEIDLTDDLAPTSFFHPTTNIVQYKGPPVPLPPGRPEQTNKLNFKFQKTTTKSTPDWTKYQNSFKRIGAASPDSDGDQSQDKDPDTAQNQVDLTSDQDENPFASLPSSVMEIVKEKMKELPAGKKPIIMPTEKSSEDVQSKQRKVSESPNASHNVTKVNASTTKDAASPLEQTTSKKPTEVKLPRDKSNINVQNPKTDVLKKDIQSNASRSINPTHNPRMDQIMFPGMMNAYYQTDYPKGIPRSFLKQQEQSKTDAAAQSIPEPYSLPNLPSANNQKIDHTMFPGMMNAHFPAEYPKGIPRSFLRQQELSKTDAAAQSIPEPYSFIKKQEQSKTDASAQSTPDSSLPNAIAEYQNQTGLDLPSWILGSQANPEPLDQRSIYTDIELEDTSPTFGRHDPTPNRAYSPSDVYSEAGKRDEEVREGSESPDMLQSGHKRLSAFQRLGPLTKPKKPKLTINLMFNKEQSVREVVDESTVSFRFVPVHLRKDVLESSDEIVKKYLPFWPWKRNIATRKSVSARNSKSVMILEQEQMEAGYEKDNMFIQVSVKGYPTTWTKENVLDAILECVKGKSFIPCFIEFTPQECKFLVIRSRSALIILHKVGFCVRSADVELTITISLTDTSLNQLDLIPRLMLRRKLLEHHVESSLDLSNFLAAPDVSHFVYFPLNRVTNQVEMIQLQSAVAWEYLTSLNLSNNRISNLDGLNLQSTTPKLRHLDLSHNLLDKVTVLLQCKDLPLRSIKLEGNPLCHDYVESQHYVKVVKMIFSGLRELDGVPLNFKGDLPPPKMNYCPQFAACVVEKFLETFFPLLEASFEDRAAIEDMYDPDAVMTITFRYKLRYGSAFRYFRNLFVRSRNLEEGDMESVIGAPAIAELVSKWPAIEHDRYTISVDTMYHDESTTILRLGGVLKLTAETLAEDEHLLTFGRTVVLQTKNGAEYKIVNEMLYWDVPREELMQTAFNITTVRNKQLSVKLESPPDEDLKSKLLNIFLRISDLDKKRGQRCLEKKNWDLRSALEFYIKLLKLDDLSPLNDPEETPLPQEAS